MRDDMVRDVDYHMLESMFKRNSPASVLRTVLDLLHHIEIQENGCRSALADDLDDVLDKYGMSRGFNLVESLREAKRCRNELEEIYEPLAHIADGKIAGSQIKTFRIDGRSLNYDRAQWLPALPGLRPKHQIEQEIVALLESSALSPSLSEAIRGSVVALTDLLYDSNVAFESTRGDGWTGRTEV